MPLSVADLQKLAEFDSPTVSNVIELFDVVPRNTGFMDGEIQCHFPDLPPMVGYAATASFRSAAPAPAGAAYASLEEQVARLADLDGPSVIVFQDLDVPSVGATFGEVMCSTYQAFGAEGLITSGGGRDIEQVEALEFPIFSGSTIVSHAYCQILNVAQPVHVGGLTVATGDLLHGDGNGVTRIPLAIASEVADAAADFMAAEKILLDYVRSSGEKTLAGLASARAECDDAIAKIAARVSRR